MTRKDSVKFAEVINAARYRQKESSFPFTQDQIIEYFMVEIADILAGDNPRFNRKLFYAACEPEPEVK